MRTNAGFCAAVDIPLGEEEISMADGKAMVGSINFSRRRLRNEILMLLIVALDPFGHEIYTTSRV